MNTLYAEKRAQVYALLNSLDIDAWLILTSDGSDPCLTLFPGVATVGKGVFLFTKRGNAYAFCSQIDAQDIEESGIFDYVIKYASTLDDEFVRVLSNETINRLAVNVSREDHLCDGLTVGRYHYLQKLVEPLDVDLVSAEALLVDLRSIKSDSEVERIRRAIQMTEEIYEEAAKAMRAGMSEREIGQIFVDLMRQKNVVNGLDRTLSMPMVLKTNIAHRPPGDYIVEAGDMLIVDFSVDVQGYVSDIARTFYFLKDDETDAPKAYKDAFSAAYDAITAAAEAIKPGVLGVDVDKAAREALLRCGYPEITHATGHQIGRFTHDGGALLAPPWARYGDQPFKPLAPGMVYTLEPTILPDDPPFVLTEENVLVGDQGVEFLSQRQESLILIPAERTGP